MASILAQPQCVKDVMARCLQPSGRKLIDIIMPVMAARRYAPFNHFHGLLHDRFAMIYTGLDTDEISTPFLNLPDVVPFIKAAFMRNH